MQAGLLKYPIKLFDRVMHQTASGFPNEQDELLYQCRANLRKQLQSFDKDGLQAHEMFNAQTLTLQVRNDRRLARARELEWNGMRFFIVMQRPNLDRTTDLICKRKDL